MSLQVHWIIKQKQNYSHLKEISNETTIILVTHRKQPLKFVMKFTKSKKVLKKVNNENIDHE